MIKNIHIHIQQKNHMSYYLIQSMILRSTSVTIGSEVGDTCPVCRKGTVEEIGGCNTCTNCNAQLKCGL